LPLNVLSNAQVFRPATKALNSASKSRPALMAAAPVFSGERPCAIKSAFEIEAFHFVRKKFPGERGFARAVAAGN